LARRATRISAAGAAGGRHATMAATAARWIPPMPAFVPDLSVILAFALAAFVLAITPGPDMALQMSRAINHGFWHGMATGAGAMTGIAVHTTLVALGISVLI